MRATSAAPASERRAEVSFDRDPGATLVVRLSGDWLLRERLPEVELVEQEISGTDAKTVAFETSSMTSWDSGALVFLTKVSEICRERSISEDRAGLPAGIRRLLALAEAVPERAGSRAAGDDDAFLARIGDATISVTTEAGGMLRFLGEVTIALGKFLIGTARYRATDLFLHIQQAGVEALLIVTLISFLVGLILAFVGAVQLQQFGATIYVANLVGIAIVRDMGAMMTGIVMAGRTGAAYAAQLGSMKVTQEIDALTTMGISPIEFLVLPRVIALSVMMPLLCLYSDLVGLLGGAAVGVFMLDLSATTYYQQTLWAVTLTDFFGGLLKAAVYGVLIALSGSLRGMQSGRSSSAVGDATTSAVVTSIVAIIVACGVFAVVFYILGI